MFEKEGIDTAEMSDEMLITIMGGLAQEESTSISNNIRWGIVRKMQSGTFITSSVPYGYRLEEGEFKIEINEAEIVRKIFKIYLQGIGTERIALYLNNNGYKRGEYIWTRNAVRYILSNEKYTGDCIFQKWYTTTTIPFRRVENKGNRDKYYVSKHHEPIISHNVFESAQKLLLCRGQGRIGYNYTKHTLSGKIYCSNCGTLYKYKMRRNQVFWVCRNHDYNAVNCNSKQISEQNFFNAFLVMYNKLKQNYTEIFPTLISQLQDLKNKKFSGNVKFTDISKEIAQHKEQIHVLTRLKTKGFLDESKYLEQSGEINSKIHKLTKEMQKITRCDDEDEVINHIKEIASFIENGPELMAEFDEVMFESLLEKIIVKNQKELEFHLYGGLVFRENI